MSQNKFYGKNVKDLNPKELTLLALDLQIMGMLKMGITNEKTFQEVYNIRLKLVVECFEYGGDYSRIRFIDEFENGVVGNDDREDYIDFIEVTPNQLCMN